MLIEFTVMFKYLSFLNFKDFEGVSFNF